MLGGNLENVGNFTDVSDWASDTMQWAVQSGLLIGSNIALNPQRDITRAEVAIILMRYIRFITN
jgi:hypothetical protein